MRKVLFPGNVQQPGYHIESCGSSLLGKLSAPFQDSRQEQCSRLKALGINAEIAERDCYEEKVAGSLVTLGIIRTAPGPITWVSVQEDSDHGNRWRMLGVPDPKLNVRFPQVRLNTVKIRKFPLLGPVTGLRWEGDDFGLGIIDRLNNEISVHSPIKSNHDLTIEADPAHGCWIMFEKVYWGQGHPMDKTLWDCYQSIAQQLLVPIDDQWDSQEKGAMDWDDKVPIYKFFIGDRVVVTLNPGIDYAQWYDPSTEHGKRGTIHRCYPPGHDPWMEKPYMVIFDGSDEIHFVRESDLVAESD